MNPKTRLLQPVATPQTDEPERSLETEEILRDRVNETMKLVSGAIEARKRADARADAAEAQLRQIRAILR